MERNDQLIKDWKNELSELKLSKERILQIEDALSSAPKKRFSPVKVIMPFAVVIVLLLLFAGMPQMDETTTGVDSTFSILQPLNGKLIGWAVAANLLAVINYVLMIAVVEKVPRVAHVPMFEAFKSRMNKRQIWQLVVATIFFAALGWGMVLLLPFGLVAVQCYIGIIFVPFVLFLQLLMTRHNEWPVCGHCGEVVSKKTMKKRYWGTTPNCECCDKPLYENIKIRQKAMRVYFFMPIIMFIPTLTQSVEMISQIFYIFICFVIAFNTIKFIDPYTIQFTDDDKIPPLW